MRKSLLIISAILMMALSTLFVELSGAGITHAVVYDLQGRIVADMSNAGGRSTATVNVQSIPAGVYLLRVTDTEGREYHRKVVKR
jgi:hypothetical protein